MTLKEILPLINATVLTDGLDLERKVSGGYCCDLLSWVMGKAKADNVLITIQTSLNVIAVATLKDLSAVIIPESTAVEPETVAKAREENIPLLSSPLSGFEISGVLYKNSVRE